jgi:hypothetical protein
MTKETPDTEANPFVGSRPLEHNEPLHGRDREIRDLDRLLAAERIVLLHSPSGAGKSSLLQAGLLPRVKTAYDVWAPTRVHQEPNGFKGVNRYALSVMQGFEQGIPEKRRRTVDEIAHQTLSEYLEGRPQRRSAPRNVLLLFDQFEEVLTTDPLDAEAKEEFFDQLKKLLQDPRVWALFVLREDYLRPLDAYAQQLPTRFQNRFRIDLLGLDGALEAMVNPAREGGREFPAAEQLVNDLASRKVQQPDGSFIEETGRHVEPVQLQVVCQRLWEGMPKDELSIGSEDLQRFGDVDLALSHYYDKSVTRIAAGDVAVERAVREWFDRLITNDGVRMQVLRSASASGGLANKLVQELLDTHLARGENRAGATWYALAHDRLAGVVQHDNQQWKTNNLSEAQRRAGTWEEQGRLSGFLVTDEELSEAERWAAVAPVVTATEEHFLDTSRIAQEVTDCARRQVRRIQVLGIVATVVGLLALVASGFAWAQMLEAEEQSRVAVFQRQEAERQYEEAERQRAEAKNQFQRAEEESQASDVARRESVANRSLAEEQTRFAETQAQVAEEQTRRAEEKELEVLAQRQVAARSQEETLAAQQETEAERQRAEKGEEQAKTEKARADATAAENERLQLLAKAEAVAVLATSMTKASHHQVAALLAVAAHQLTQRHGGDPWSSQGHNALRLALRRLHPSLLLTHRSVARSLAVVDDGDKLAFGDERGALQLIDLQQPSATPRVLGSFRGGVRALAWRPKGRLLVAGGRNGAVRLWDLDEADDEDKTLRSVGAAVEALVFFPDGKKIAAGDAKGGVRVWEIGAAQPTDLSLPSSSLPGSDGDDVQVSALAVHPNGDVLAAASRGQGVLLFQTGQLSEPPRLLAHDVDVDTIDFSADGLFLAAGSGSGTVWLWKLDASGEPRGEEPQALPGPRSRISNVKFHPRRSVLASAGHNGNVRLWDVERPALPPLVLADRGARVWSAAFTPDGKRLISTREDRSIHLGSTTSGALVEAICQTVSRQLTPAEWSEYLPDFAYDKVCSKLP